MINTILAKHQCINIVIFKRSSKHYYRNMRTDQKQPIQKSQGSCWLGCIVSGARETMKSKISLSDRSMSLRVYQMPKILQDLTSLESWHHGNHFIFCCDDRKVTVQCQKKMFAREPFGSRSQVPTD